MPIPKKPPRWPRNVMLVTNYNYALSKEKIQFDYVYVNGEFHTRLLPPIRVKNLLDKK